MKTLLFTFAALTALAGAVLSAPKPATLTCPVTGEKIASPAAAAGHEAYKGKIYYFCCSACQPVFDKNRDKVITAAAHGKHQ